MWWRGSNVCGGLSGAQGVATTLWSFCILLALYVLVPNLASAWTISQDVKKAIVLIENPARATHGSGIVINGQGTPFLVTSQHVLDGADTILVRFPDESETGEPRISGVGVPVFLRHGDREKLLAGADDEIDVGIVPLVSENLAHDVSCWAVNLDQLITDSVATAVGVNEGDDVLVIGFSFRPAGGPCYHVIRRGLLSLMTRDKIHFSVGGRTRYENIYLVDVNLFPGDSGCPVVVRHGTNEWILGIVFALWTSSGPVNLLVPPDTIPVKAQLTQYMDLGLVVPAARVRQMIEEFLSDAASN